MRAAWLTGILLLSGGCNAPEPVLIGAYPVYPGYCYRTLADVECLAAPRPYPSPEVVVYEPPWAALPPR